jgi:hypothetical protein
MNVQERVEGLRLRLQKFGSSSSSSSNVRIRTFVGKAGSSSVTYHEMSPPPPPPLSFLRSGFVLGRKGGTAAASRTGK